MRPGFDGPAAGDADLDQLADAVLVERLERVVLDDALLEIAGEELPLGVVSREAERRLREVVRAEGEEVGVPGDLAGPQRGAGQLDHRPAQVLEPGRLRGHHPLGELAQPVQLLGVRDQRVHDLDPRRRARANGDRLRRTRDRPHLHLVDLGPLQAEAAAARAQHRVHLAERRDALAHPVAGRLVLGRQELVQRRVEQPDRDRKPCHRREHRLEVGLLEGQEPVERRPAGGLVLGQDHLLDDREPLLAEEHVLGAAEADSLGAEPAGALGVDRRVRVRAHAEQAERVGPGEDGLEIRVRVRARRAARHR